MTGPEKQRACPEDKSRRRFVNISIKALLGTLLGVSTRRYGKMKQKNLIEQQVISGRLRPLSRNMLEQLLGTEAASDERFQRYNDKLWIDTHHLAWTDQAYDQWLKCIQLLNGEQEEIHINISDTWESILGKTHLASINTTIKRDFSQSPTKETIQRLFENIILHLRNQTEQGQYNNFLLNHFGATAGVPSDTNANILSIYIAQNMELMKYIYQTYGNYDEQQKKIVVDFTSPEVLTYLFGDTNSNQEIDNALIKHLGTTKEIVPQAIVSQDKHNPYPGLSIEIKK